MCDNGNDGSASPKHSEILSWAVRSHKVFKNKKGSISFNSCCSLNPFRAYEVLNAHLRLFRGTRLIQPQTKTYVLLRKYNQPFLGGSFIYPAYLTLMYQKTESDPDNLIKT